MYLLPRIKYLTINKYMFSRAASLLCTLFSVLVAIKAQNLNWNWHDDIRTGQQVMYSSNTFYNSSQTPISYYIVYSSVLTSTRSAGIGIVGFNTLITNDYSVNTTIENFTLYSLRVTAKVYGSTLLTFFSVNWIAVGNTVDFAQVLFSCYLCGTLNSGRGPRSQNLTGSTVFIGYNTLFVNVYLAGFQLHNSDGLTNYLNATVSIPAGSNIINYKFATNQNNTVTQICYTTIVFCEIITKTLYYNWGQVGSEVMSNTAGQDPTQFPFPAWAAGAGIDYQSRNKMFFGMGAFSLSRASRRLFNIDTTDYGNLNSGYQSNTGTFAVRVDFFWLAVRQCNNTVKWFDVIDLQCRNNCPNGGRNQTQPGDFCASCHYTCTTCDAAHYNNCSSCDQNLFRYENNLGGSLKSCPCNNTYIDIGVPLCYPCQSFIPGCRTCITVAMCTECLPGFILQPSGVCQCTIGYLVSGICTTITGCTAAVQYAGTTFCTSCNTTLNYVVNSNYTCSCQAGFYLSLTDQCLSTCGDSKQVATQACDDGNLINGDGCSSICIVQDKWKCEGGSQTSRSTCYIFDNITMSIKYVRRVTSSNKMQVGIEFQPFYTQLTQTNFKKYISHNVPSTDFNATYSNGMLVLEFDYNRTIEGQFFTMNLTLDPNLFYNSQLSIQIPASGMNGKLTYDSFNQINYPMEIIVIILDVIAIIVMFASCVSERMIGIQMIQTLQTVLYTQAVMKTTPSSLTPLQMLRYSSGFNQIQGIDYSRTYTFAFSLSSLGLEKQFLLSYNLMYAILVAVILACLILKAKQYYHITKTGKFVEQLDQNKNQQKLYKTTKAYNFIFERVLFLVCFMCMFLIIFALMLQLTDMSSDYTLVSKQLNLLGAIIAIAILATLICGVILNGCFPSILLFPMLMKQYYPPVYFIYQSAFIFLLAFDYTQQYVLYILAAMSVIFLIYNMIYRPYPEKFHTFVLIFHQVVILGVIGVYIFENLTKPKQAETFLKIINGVIILVLYLVVCLNGYRIYKYYKFLKINGWDQYGNPDLQNQNDFDENYYKNLRTAKEVVKSPRKIEQNYGTGNADTKNSKNRQVQLEPIKKIKENNSNNTKSKLPKDESALNWKYNKLADEDNNEGNDGRYDATKRDVRPDTNRDSPINRTKTNEKNFRTGQNDDENLDDDYTIKNNNDKNSRVRGNDIEEPNNDQNKYKNYDINDNHYRNDDDQNVFDNPYDDTGFSKNKQQKKSKVEQEDPLQAIKRRLKKDFNSKIKVSTIKEA